MFNLTIEQFKLDRQVLADFIDDADTEVFFGFDNSGQLGWHLIVDDYPSFSVLFCGATFADALVWCKEFAKEKEEDWSFRVDPDPFEEEEKDPSDAWEVDQER